MNKQNFCHKELEGCEDVKIPAVRLNFSQTDAAGAGKNQKIKIKDKDREKDREKDKSFDALNRDNCQSPAFSNTTGRQTIRNQQHHVNK